MKNIFLLAALLLPSFSSIQMAWSKDYGESAEECYRLMEKLVNAGNKIESKYWFFHLPEHKHMQYADYDKNNPMKQSWNFQSTLRGTNERVTMQILEDQDLEKELKKEDVNQSSMAEKDKVVRRYVITHCTRAADDSCAPRTKNTVVFDIQNPSSKNCFKTIKEGRQDSDPEVIYRSSFCQKWKAFSVSAKSDSRSDRNTKFQKENPGWEKELNKPFAAPMKDFLNRSISRCNDWTASDKAQWDASGVPSSQIPSTTTDTGRK